MKYFLHLSYKGTNYSGWQRQNDVPSIQQTIEEAIKKVTKQKITIQGCGRTDAGVHSSNYIAQVNFEQSISDDFLLIINQTLPNDIVIHQCLSVDPSSQAQFHVQKRRYDYYFHTSRNPLINEFSTFQLDQSIDLEKMKDALNQLIGVHDFRGFCKSPDKHVQTICHITKAKIYHKDDRYQIRIEGNRFLRSMVRLIVGNLLLIGNGKMKIDQWNKALRLEKEFDHFNLAYPQGLHLSGIYYPSKTYIQESIYSIDDIHK